MNMRGMKLHCSWFYPNNPVWPMPVIVYCHGNCSNRLSGFEILYLLAYGFTVFTFDSSGSGNSDGNYISLGFYERQDISAIVDFLHTTKKVSAIGLWGRSMGAAAIIMYASVDPSINCIVCDSPYSTLRYLIQDIIDMKIKIVPDAFSQYAIRNIRKKVANLAYFDIDYLDCIKYAKNCIVPAFIFHGKEDKFVRYEHSLIIADNYGGLCIHNVVDGDHNSVRGDDVRKVAITFLRLFLIEKPREALLSKVRKVSITMNKSRELVKNTIKKLQSEIDYVHKTPRAIKRAELKVPEPSTVRPEEEDTDLK